MKKKLPGPPEIIEVAISYHECMNCGLFAPSWHTCTTVAGMSRFEVNPPGKKK